MRDLSVFDTSNDGWGFSKKDEKKAKVCSKKSELWGNFKSKANSTSKPAFQPRKNRESCEDYTEVFLCHARLYVFADKYDVGPLRDLSLHKLQRTLAEFILDDKRAEDIVNLLRYNYSNITDCSESIDDLRLLVDGALCQIAKTLFPSSEVNRCRIRTFRYEMPNFPSLHLVISS